jgi:hypothetical protein
MSLYHHLAAGAYIYAAIAATAFLIVLLVYLRPVMAAVFALVALNHLEFAFVLAMAGFAPAAELLSHIKALDPASAAEAAGLGSGCFTLPLLIFLRGKESERREARARNRPVPPPTS